MERTVITVREYCLIHPPAEPRFVEALLESGLVELAPEAPEPAIPYDALSDLERLLRLHYDLEINLAGLETIHHMLRRMESLQAEVRRLQDYEHLFASGNEGLEEID
jgi:hypothetical protein